MPNETAAPAAPAAAPVAPAAVEPAKAGPLTFERTVTGQMTSAVAPAPAPKPAPPPVAAAPEPVKPPEPAKPPEAEKRPDDKPNETQQRLSQQVALLARRERQIVQREQALKQQLAQREQSFKELEAKLQAQQTDLQKRLDEMQSARGNPLKWLEMGGHSYDALAQQMLNDQQPTPELQVRAAREDLEGKLATQRKELEAKIETERQEREKLIQAERQRIEHENQLAVQRFNQQALDFGTQHASRFPLTTAFQQQGQVPVLIEQYYRESLQADTEAAGAEGRQPVGKILSFEEAYGLIEQHYRGLYEQAQKAMTPKPDEKPAAASATPAAPAAPEQNLQGERPTLTNNLASDANHAKPSDQLSDDERWQRALAAMDAVAAAKGVRRP